MTTLDLGADITNQPRSTTVYSSVAVISGAPLGGGISISGDPSSQYSFNGGAWENSTQAFDSSFDPNGKTIQVRHVSASGFSSSVSTTLTAFSGSDTWGSTTEAEDTTPDAFDFVDVSGVEPGSVNTSAPITVTGINSQATATSTGGSFNINGSFFVTTGYPGNFDEIRARGTASASYSTPVHVDVTIGGVTGRFTITTRDADTTPNAFTFTDQSAVVASSVCTSNEITITGIEAAANVSFSTSGGSSHEYRKFSGGAWGSWAAVAATTVANNEKLQVRLTAPGTAGQAGNITMTVGGVSDTFSATVANPDSTPDQFTFVDAPDVAKSTVATSNIITIAGIDTTANVSFSTSGGSSHEYRKNGGAWTAVAATTVVVGDTLQVRATVPATAGQTASITMTVGGVSDTFTATAQEPDTTPSAFAFTAATGVDPLTVTASNAITVAGINTAAAISVLGGEYSVNGGAYTSSPGTVARGDSVTVRGTSAATLTTTVNVTLTIGGVAGVFAITTRSPDFDSQYVVTFREASHGISY